MKNNADYDSVFNESDSYLEMLLTVTLKGGNKAKMNRFLQKSWQSLSPTYRWSNKEKNRSNKERKLVLFIKEGINEGEIPMKFLWNMLNCPKSIDEINKCWYNQANVIFGCVSVSHHMFKSSLLYIS